MTRLSDQEIATLEVAMAEHDRTRQITVIGRHRGLLTTPIERARVITEGRWRARGADRRRIKREGNKAALAAGWRKRR